VAVGVGFGVGLGVGFTVGFGVGHRRYASGRRLDEADAPPSADGTRANTMTALATAAATVDRKRRSRIVARA
jgi:hypothetical protein